MLCAIHTTCRTQDPPIRRSAKTSCANSKSSGPLSRAPSPTSASPASVPTAPLAPAARCPGLRLNPTKFQLTYCPECLKKQLVIDRLQEEIVRLKARLRYQERTAKEGPFGSSTPSAKVPLKASTPPEN